LCNDRVPAHVNAQRDTWRQEQAVERRMLKRQPEERHDAAIHDRLSAADVALRVAAHADAEQHDGHASDRERADEDR